MALSLRRGAMRLPSSSFACAAVLVAVCVFGAVQTHAKFVSMNVDVRYPEDLNTKVPFCPSRLPALHSSGHAAVALC